MTVKFSLLFFVVAFAAEAEDQFFQELQSSLESNFCPIPSVLGCDTPASACLTFGCSGGGLLTSLTLRDLSLSAIPSSISSLSLHSITITNCNLSSLCSELSSLKTLLYLDLRNNPFLEANTVMFAGMTGLTELHLDSTLISGFLPLNDRLTSFSCSSSCISGCPETSNASCPCSSFSFSSSYCSGADCSWCDLSQSCFSVSSEECRSCDSFDSTDCPSYCPSDSCGNCSLIDSSSDCDSPCFWCDSSSTCLSSNTFCQTCDSFNPNDCPSGCDENCGGCSLIIERSGCASPCSWCDSSNSCLSSNECSTEQPDSSAPSESDSSLTLILICVLVPVLVVVVLIVSLVLRKRARSSTVHKLDSVLSTTNITFEDTTSFDL